MRTAARKDLQQPVIVDALRKAGVRVRVLNEAGLPDLVCEDSSTGEIYLMEVKAVMGRLTTLQEDCSLTFVICRTAQEALTDLQRRRSVHKSCAPRV